MKKKISIIIISIYVFLNAVLIIYFLVTINRLNNRIYGLQKIIDRKSFDIKELNQTNKNLYEANQHTIHPISKKLIECQRKENYTLDGMFYCIDVSINDWSKEVDKNLSLLKTVLTPEEYKLLQNSQYNWEKYKKYMFTLLENTLGNQTGLYFVYCANSSKAIIIRDRAAELEFIYEELKFSSEGENE